MKKEINVIPIEWVKYEYDDKIIKSLNQPYDFGIYQIYGRHKAYGKDALLYIGEATDRTFSVRLKDGGRNDCDFNETTVEPLYLRIGRIVFDRSVNNLMKEQFTEFKSNWDDNIRMAERLLIATHPPALNKKIEFKLADFVKLKDHYLILNGGDYGDLLPEVSTIRNSYEFYGYFDTKENYLRNDE